MIFIRTVGKFLISVGVGVLLFVAWVLYGTGLYTAQQQEELSDLFNRLPEFHSASGIGGPPKSFNPGPGDPVFRMRIPKIKLNDGKGFMVVEGVDPESLQLGPGHYPSCRKGFADPLCTGFPAAWPGEKGRVIISGHRTTYLQPFYNIDKLSKGDEIFIETRWGDFTYVVYKQEVVAPDDPTIVIRKQDARELVLTTCNPRFSAAQRLITSARMVTPV